MLSKVAIALLIGLCRSVENEISVTDANLVATLEESSTVEGVDWNAVVAEMRSGIDDGIEEGRRHVDGVAHLEQEEREEEDACFRHSLIRRLRELVWEENTVDRYTLVYGLAAIATGISFQILAGFSAQLGRRFDADPSGETTVLGTIFSTAYIFAIQGFVMSLVAPLTQSEVPLPFKEVPKAALLSGVFLVLQIASAVAAFPVVGFELGGLIVVGGEIATGLSMDATGFFGFAAKRKVGKAKLAGGMVLASGLLSSAAFRLNGLSGNEIAALLPFIGLSGFQGASGTVATALNGALVPYTGSSLKAGAISFFLGTMMMMAAGLTLSFVDHAPAIDFNMREWWVWAGPLVGIYGMWCSAWIPKKLGFAEFYAVSNIGYLGSSVAADAWGLFGEAITPTAPRAVAVAICIIGMLVVQFVEGPVLAPAWRIAGQATQEEGHADVERAVEDLGNIELGAASGAGNSSSVVEPEIVGNSDMVSV